MNYRNAAVVSVVASLMAGCAYLPTGYSSRSSGQSRVEADQTEKLFSSDPAQQVVPDSVAGVSSGSATGLRVRKSKRGNMDSYVVRGQRYFTLDESDGYSARGLASWYGPNFHGRTASNGEVYDMYKMTAAHKTLPLPTFARVSHIDNGKSIIVKINDRGPFSGDRLIDLSFAAALELGMVNDGTAMVEIQALSAEELVAISGPKNKLGVEFYYDAGSETKSASLPASELFTNDDSPAESSTEMVAVAVQNESLNVPLTSAEGAQVTGVTVADSLLPQVPSAAVPMPVPVVEGSTSVAMAQPGSEGVVVVVPEYLEVIVPGRKRPSADADIQFTDVNDSGSDIFPSENVVAVAGAETGADSIPQAQRVAVPLIETAAVSPSLALGSVPAVAVPKKVDPVSSIRYYIQAGVYADVQDAEKIAVDIVLKIPQEEVHVKPLKDSRMYRVTVGPIVTDEHAREVAAKLTDSGLDNYTVKVNEI